MLLSDEIDELISQVESITIAISNILNDDNVEIQQIENLNDGYKLRNPLLQRLNTIYNGKDGNKEDKVKIKEFFNDLKEIDEVNIHSIDSKVKILADKIRLLNKSKNLKVYSKWR